MDIQLFLMLVAGHYLADFALQDDFIARNKAAALKTAMGFHTLTAHSAIQGLVAGLISQNLAIGLIVAATHWFIDFGKAAKSWYGINIDQFLHILVIFLAVVFVS